MNYYKFYLIILTLSLTFISCESDDSNDISNGNLKLLKIDFFDSENNLTGTTHFIYDEELRLIAERDQNGNDLFTYTYENDKITSITSNGGTIINYIYENGLIVSSSRTINGNLSPNALEYEYDNLDRLIRTKIYENGNLSCEINDTFDDQNNIVTSVSSCQGTEPTQNSFVYDEMKNPAFLFFNSELLKVLRVGTNNTLESYDNDMNLTSSSTYQYNDDGYPTVSTTTNTIYNTLYGLSEFTQAYTYETIE
jgi:antitoxin component YwqK of YwqJK toxin-antitoxin module